MTKKFTLQLQRCLTKKDSNQTSQQPTGPSSKVKNYAVNSKLCKNVKQKIADMPKRIIPTFTFFIQIFCMFSK